MLTPRYLLIVYQDKSGGWRWSIEHRNGNIIADSGEGYASRSGAIRAARRLRVVAEQAELAVRGKR